jgi:uncharacterized protein
VTTGKDLVWSGIEEANPWWITREVPAERAPQAIERDALPVILGALESAEQGRGLVVLGPRRIGKTVLLHQMIRRLIARGRDPLDLVYLSLDDVALRGADLGLLLDLVEARRPRPAPDRPRVLLLDEVQHSPEWSGWLKRIADRRDPYVFVATGSSATAIRRGGQDALLGRAREMTLFPWSFREHIRLRGLPSWSFTYVDRLAAIPEEPAEKWAAAIVEAERDLGPPPPDESERLEAALVDYFIRGGFPEVARVKDFGEARRRLRQDILDRSLGRDITDVLNVDSRLLERMFLRICQDPGGPWNETEVAKDLGVTRPTVARYLRVLEESFLVFRLPNLASPVKGQPKVYLVSPAMRQALFSLGESEVRLPEQWGRVAENAVVAAAVGTRPGAHIGFWRKGRSECDVVVSYPDRSWELIEVKRNSRSGQQGLAAADADLKPKHRIATILGHAATWQTGWPTPERPFLLRHEPVAFWLYRQSAAAGGTLRL